MIENFKALDDIDLEKVSGGCGSGEEWGRLPFHCPNCDRMVTLIVYNIETKPSYRKAVCEECGEAFEIEFR